MVILSSDDILVSGELPLLHMLFGFILVTYIAYQKKLHKDKIKGLLMLQPGSFRRV